MSTDTYTVESRLEMTSNVPEILDQMIAGFGDVDSLINETKEALGQLTADLRELSGADRGITRLVESFQRLADIRLGAGLFDDLAEVRDQAGGINVLQERLTEIASGTATQWAQIATEVERAGQAMRTLSQAEVPAAARGRRRQAADAPAGPLADFQALGRDMQGLGEQFRLLGAGPEAAALGAIVGDMERAVGFAHDLAGAQDQIARTAASAAGSWKEIADATKAASGRVGRGVGTPGAGPSLLPGAASPPPPPTGTGESWSGVRYAANGRAIGPDGLFISNDEAARREQAAQRMRDAYPAAAAEDRDYRERARQNAAVLNEQRRNAEADNRDFDARHAQVRAAADYENRDRDLQHAAQQKAEQQAFDEAWNMARWEKGNREQIARAAATRRKEMFGTIHDHLGHVGSIGIGLQFGSDAPAGFFERSIMDNFQVEHLLAQFRQNMSITPDQVAAVRAKAKENAEKLPGTTIAENVSSILDAYTVTGNIKEALDAGAALSRLNLIFESLPGTHHNDPAFAAARSVELMQKYYDPKTGAIDLGEMTKQMNAMAVVGAATGGRVQPDAYVGFAQQARAGGMLASDQFLYRDLPAMLISMGGHRAGTGDAAVWRQFIQGRMTENAFEELQKVGIIDKKATWSHGRVNDMMEHLKDAQGFIGDPAQWMRTTGRSLFETQGIDLYNPGDRVKLENNLSQWSSTTMGLGFLSELALGIRGIDKEADKIGQGNQDPLKVIADNDPMYQLKVFEAAETNFMTALGSNLMGPAIKSLQELTNVLNELSSLSEKYPNAAKDIALAAAGATTFAKLAGDVALAIFVGSPVITGFKALANAVLPFSKGGEAAEGIEAVSGGISKLGGILAMFGLVAEVSRRNAFENIMPGDPHAQAEAAVGGEWIPSWGDDKGKDGQKSDESGFWSFFRHSKSDSAKSEVPDHAPPKAPSDLYGFWRDMIGRSEGTDRGRGYDETLAYGAYTGGPVDLTHKTLAEVHELQRQMLANPAKVLHSSAVGRYQITSSTMKDLESQLHLDPNTTLFSPQVQDQMADALLRKDGLDAFGRGNLSSQDLLHNLSGTWASLPDPAKGGVSHYAGQHASFGMDDTLEQLAQARVASQAFGPPGGMPNLLPPSAPPGATDPTALQPPSGQTIQLRGDLRIDGRKHGEYTANTLADRLTTPPSGPTQPNLRLTPGFVSAIPSFGGT